MTSHRISGQGNTMRPLHMVAGATAIVLVIGTIDYITGSQVSLRSTCSRQGTLRTTGEGHAQSNATRQLHTTLPLRGKIEKPGLHTRY